MSSALSTDLLETLDKLAGGVHPGFRPVHAKSAMCSGTFTPSLAAAKLTRAPHPIPTSYARQAYFAITAFTFTSADGQRRFGRFRLRPEARTEFLSPEQAAKQSADFLAAELAERLARGPAKFRVLVQLAERG